MNKIDISNMHYDEAFIEFLTLVTSEDFNEENTVNGSIEFSRGVVEENGQVYTVLKATNTTMNVDDVEKESVYNTILYKDRIETDIPATNEGMEKARHRLREYVEGMFCVLINLTEK